MIDYTRLRLIRDLRAELHCLAATLDELPTWCLTQFASTLELIHQVRRTNRGHVEPPLDDEPRRGPARAIKWSRE